MRLTIFVASSPRRAVVRPIGIKILTLVPGMLRPRRAVWHRHHEVLPADTVDQCRGGVDPASPCCATYSPRRAESDSAARCPPFGLSPRQAISSPFASVPLHRAGIWRPLAGM